MYPRHMEAGRQKQDWDRYISKMIRYVPLLNDVQQSVLHERMDRTERDAKHSELTVLSGQEWWQRQGLSTLNLCPSSRIVVHCKTVRLSILVHEGNLDNIAPMHGENWPRPLLMIHAIIESVDVSHDSEIVGRAGYSGAR